ncbi:B3 domain-containing protein At1g49475-like [Euphorbia lathyris]|uniref:B3 domain-containing protein At1g49475-like n=1 Tax=Euphorbia lathyris TaxID=212925 RepID=UPI0033135356
MKNKRKHFQAPSTMDSESHSKTPMFFKIIFHDTIKQGTLEIPSGFVKKIGNCLSDSITLKVPNGETWEVEISKVGEEVWLGKGWVEFSEHHSLKYGHLLMFKYQGNSQFNVLIFDMSATEVKYPIPGSKDSKSQLKMEKNKEITAPSSDRNIQPFGGNVGSSGSKVDRSGMNFSSSNPWFKIVIYSMGKQQRYVNVPYVFVKNNMECKTKTVMLKVEDKSWPVKLHVYLRHRTAGFYCGIASFIRENSLKDGDFFICELISNDVFDVSIFRI